MPRVSVIIPTYNRERFVVPAIESVLRQSFSDRELIVVDDGSTDITQLRLARFQNQIRYVCQANAGPGAARNTGIQVSAGEWLAFLDSDDEWTTEYLARQFQHLESRPEICLQTTDCRFYGKDGQVRSFFDMNGVAAILADRDYLLPSDPFSFVLRHSPWQLGSTVMRRDAINRAGWFDESLRISEDLDLLARVALQGPFGIVRENLVNIHRREEPIECLTSQARNHAFAARESDEHIYEKLNRWQNLTAQQRKVLRSVMSANRRAMGNLLLQTGQTREARQAYRRAFSLDHSLKSLGRYVLSWS
jgi:glycosyltransferase involved in cell wall biosynthesis